MKTIKKILTTLFFITALIQCNAHATPQPQKIDAPVKAYINELHKRYKFQPHDLKTLFTQAHYNPEIIVLINHQFEKHPWYQYRKIFLGQHRVQQGVLFWQQHKKALNEAEKKYGVPPNIIIAILGVETFYGKRKGNYPVIDSLITLAFHYPRRAKFFKQELTQYLLLTREQHLPPLTLTGSYAGAIGIPQFMPSTYRHYAVDYSNQGSSNLVHNTEDAIFSVANYLAKSGWQHNQPISKQLHTQKISSALISSNAKPQHNVLYYKKKGVEIAPTINNALKTSIIKLPTKNINQPEYWLTFVNFSAIMRYNPHINYAMAVFQLSEAIKNEYQRKHTTASTKSSPTWTAHRSAGAIPTATCTKSK